MIEITLSHEQFAVLMNALRRAEDSFTRDYIYKGATNVSKLWSEIYKQVHTYGQVEEDEIEYEEE